MTRRPPRSTQSRSSAASDVYKRQDVYAGSRLCASGHPRRWSALPRHGSAGLLALENNMMEAVALPQNECFEAAIKFARTEGIIPAPESSHAIASALRVAGECKQSGESKSIVFGLSGHGHFDMAAYDEYLGGNLEDFAYPEEKIKESMADLPKM